MGQMNGKFAIIAGAASSLRDAAATRLRNEGAELAMIDPSATALQEAVTASGRMDALVNVFHAGAEWRDFAESSGASLATALEQVNAFAETMRAAFPLLKQAQGRVVNVGSPYGSTAYAKISDAVTADYALQGLTRAVAVEWARDNVLVNYISPGALDIPEFQAFRKLHGAAVDHRVQGLALGRLGDPVEDFGGALMFLLSDEACFIIGHPVYADGGQHLVAPVFEPGANFAAVVV
jgi:3-oxoacyl-[acyl-carrier protein] reductase